MPKSEQRPGGGAAAENSEAQRSESSSTRIESQAQAEADSTITLEEALRVAMRCNSYTRLPAIIGLWHRMDRDDWLALLGDSWSVCDNISAHLPWLRAMLPRVGPARPMMEPQELAAWEALPDRVTIYRGARVWLLGASWSLDKAVAERFPSLHRYNVGGAPVLLTAAVRKRDILALKLDRQEAEIIVLRGRRIISREFIERGLRDHMTAGGAA